MLISLVINALKLPLKFYHMHTKNEGMNECCIFGQYGRGNFSLLCNLPIFTEQLETKHEL